MALTDRPFVKRLLSEAESRLGVAVLPARDKARYQTMEQEFEEFRGEAEDLAWHTYDYVSGRPGEMRPERRRRLAQRSRIALAQDPLAGAEAQLLADFAFGKGVSVPSAKDPDVQDVIDQCWNDPINQKVLFSYEAQRKLSNELLTTGELFPTMYVRGGSVRFGRLDPDLVRAVVTDPENRLIPLWYLVADRRFEWSFDNDQPKFTDQVAAQHLKLKYWAHWRFVEIAKKERETDPVGEDETPLEEPPADRLAKGLVHHVAINQTGEQLRGNPPWARSLRFMSAMNVLTESHVTMAQAAATFIAKREMRGTQRQIAKAAVSVMDAAGELGAAALRPTGWGAGGNAEPTTEPFTSPDKPGPFPPGSWWHENETSNLQALSLSSGAAQMAQTAQIVRAPVAANSGFGQHYLGDASNANLASASTLELPATMRIAGWQEHFEGGVYRWATDRAIEAAVKSGRLGGNVRPDGGRSLEELRIEEAVDRAEMEGRTGKDLSYEFTMPFPGRRQLADVITVVQQGCQTMDPNGVNIPLRRQFLKFLYEQMGIDDVARAVEDAIPDGGVPGGIGPPQSTGNAPGSFGGQPSPGAGAAPGSGRTGARVGAAASEPGDGQQPYGARSGTAAGGGSAGTDGALEHVLDLEGWLEQDAALLSDDERTALDALEGEAERLFRRMVERPVVAATAGLPANGDGPAHDAG